MIFEKYLIVALVLCACLSLSISADGEDVKEKKNLFIANTKKVVSMIKDTHQKRVKRYVIPLEYFKLRTKQDIYRTLIAESARHVEHFSGQKRFILGNDTKVFTITEPNHQNQLTIVVAEDLPEFIPHTED